MEAPAVTDRALVASRESAPLAHLLVGAPDLSDAGLKTVAGLPVPILRIEEGTVHDSTEGLSTSGQ